MSGGLRREFLGWERAPLASAADWLLAEHGPDLSRVVVALPGARAGRRLGELLARRAPASWVPPRILTQGALVDELVRLDRPVAPRFARTLAWDAALEALPPGRRASIARRAGIGGAPRDLGERVRLAETVRALHGRLAPEGLQFADLAAGEARPASESEAARWEALAQAQEDYRERLAAAGLADPHEARLHAIREGRVKEEGDVVLVGVADMTRLLARLLEALAGRATALVAAPESLTDGFDELGRLRTEVWRDRPVPLPLEAWRVVEKPVDQAEAVRDVLAGWGGRHAPDRITVGVADDEVAPYLHQELGACGAAVRDAAGTPLARTRPFRALRAAARWLARGSYRDLASLVRHPDVEARLPDAVRDRAVPALDAYHGRHLPGTVDGTWLRAPRDDSHAVVEPVHRAVQALLGELAGGAPQPLPGWVEPTLAFLRALYGDRPLDREGDEADRVVAGALEKTADVLAELADLPATLRGPEVDAGEALELVLRRLEGEAVPPSPPRAEAPAIELLGWLELPLDDAPALIVTGFQDRQVHDTVLGDAFLPDAACRALGLPCNDDRLARDAYATTLLLATRAHAAFVTGRRSQTGDPHVPSRLAFQVGEDEVVARVRRFVDAGDVPPPAPAERTFAEIGPRARGGLPRLEPVRAVSSMSVSSFRLFLESPYRFYLERVLGLDTGDDRAAELDALAFGVLAHDALEAFGRSDVRHGADAPRIAAFLEGEVHRLAAARYGERPLPAVALQVEQLVHRLGFFARRQAERARDGWRVERVEWTAPEDAALDVDGAPMRLTGRIDRVDVHPATGRWAVLDYKTGETKRDPVKAHRKGDDWVDLQLPLYAHLTRGLAKELGVEGPPELGYVTLGKKEEDVAFLAGPWADGDLAEALDVARDVVRRVRAGDYFEDPGDAPAHDPLVAALFDQGLLEGDDEAEEGA